MCHEIYFSGWCHRTTRAMDIDPKNGYQRGLQEYPSTPYKLTSARHVLARKAFCWLSVPLWAQISTNYLLSNCRYIWVGYASTRCLVLYPLSEWFPDPVPTWIWCLCPYNLQVITTCYTSLGVPPLTKWALVSSLCKYLLQQAEIQATRFSGHSFWIGAAITAVWPSGSFKQYIYLPMQGLALTFLSSHSHCLFSNSYMLAPNKV